MKNTRRAGLAVALLASLSPGMAWAAEAHLTPGSNGGSGAMPSGYSELHFDLAEGDWVDALTLPVNPRPGDTVILRSSAAAPARLDAANTTFSDLEYLPVDAGTRVAFFWDPAAAGWLVLGGWSARMMLPSRGEHEMAIPASSHALTQVHDNGWEFNALTLPAQAPGGAQLSISGNQRSNIELRDGNEKRICPAKTACAFVFNSADGRWHARTGRADVQTSQVDLPAPAHRWTRLVVGSPANDLATPGMLRLPGAGTDGDIYQVDNPSGDHFAYLLTDNSSLVEAVPVSSGPHTFRFDASQKTWIQQPK
ncbi:hypothetical protein [Stenotrophomonas sp. AR026]|uniref:hypothetical protein n=1 Tax=Stenotrophomonas sp. AR026 TaxID=3398462 RepID=UPI003BB09CEB